jgi:hypothetical protein
MQQNLEKEVARFRQMTVIELRARYAELFGEPTGVTNKGWLCKRLPRNYLWAATRVKTYSRCSMSCPSAHSPFPRSDEWKRRWC